MQNTEFIIDLYKLKWKKSDPLRSPLFIGDFSLDGQRKFHSDRRNLKFCDKDIFSKKIYFDLNKSLSKVVRKNVFETKKEKLDLLLEWILRNKFKFVTEETKHSGFTRLSTDFVSFRGLLTELLCTPYEPREGWIIHATKFASTIYLLGVETPEKEQQRLSETEQNRVMCSWGYKFEQFMTNEDPNEGVNENEEYCCVLRSRLSQHSCVYGAEVDCADKELYQSPHSSLSAFIELKTCKELVTPRDFNNFHRYRLRKCWAQSYLVGIPRVIYGFRDAGGVVHSVKSFKVEEMPNLSKDHWSKDVMLNFLNDFLSWVKSVVEVDDPAYVYKFCHVPRENRITCISLGRSQEERFLPNFYTQKMFEI